MWKPSCVVQAKGGCNTLESTKAVVEYIEELKRLPQLRQCKRGRQVNVILEVQQALNRVVIDRKMKHIINQGKVG
jgi:hypothetical protein